MEINAGFFVGENLGGIYFCYLVSGRMFKNSVGILLKFKNLEFVLKISILFPYTPKLAVIKKKGTN